MMAKLRALFVQTILISFGIIFAMTLQGAVSHFQGKEISFPWYHLLSVIAVAFLGSIPGLLLRGLDNRSKKEVFVRIVVHCALVYSVTMGMGLVFQWYDSLLGFVLISISFLFIYLFVWCGAFWMGKHDASQINSALDSIRDKE